MDKSSPAPAPAPAPRRVRVALTGGIACGKSLLTAQLNALGVKTLDADDVVHALVPAAERRELAKRVFADASARRELEARLHPLVRARLEEFLAAGPADELRLVVVPLLFEVHWDADFDIIVCVKSKPEVQVARMMTTRGYTLEEAQNRLSAQWPVADKAAKSQYTIDNSGSPEDLAKEAERLVSWLKNSWMSLQAQ